MKNLNSTVFSIYGKLEVNHVVKYLGIKRFKQHLDIHCISIYIFTWSCIFFLKIMLLLYYCIIVKCVCGNI
jgi:hypothetical protein